MKTLSIGAEAIVVADEKEKIVVKQRQPKKYRIKKLDDKLRLHRMRREIKVMESLQQIGIPVPGIISAEEKKTTIIMQLIEGEKVRDALNKQNYAEVCSEIGKHVGAMHSNNIIHGDLTTSNMIRGNHGKIHLIDFGLSLFSNKDEDKAVDLHLFRQALSSSHHELAEKCFATAIKSYKKANSRGWKEVLKRLEKVDQRGRNKQKRK